MLLSRVIIVTSFAASVAMGQQFLLGLHHGMTTEEVRKVLKVKPTATDVKSFHMICDWRFAVGPIFDSSRRLDALILTSADLIPPPSDTSCVVRRFQETYGKPLITEADGSMLTFRRDKTVVTVIFLITRKFIITYRLVGSEV